ncbi:uncharacterized protein TNCV_954051 [Trichonephila clavipes]|nr:uncharacterized protein TNCV_954051 [Trichonephila clavipes]
MSRTSCNHMCCHSCNDVQESFFNKTRLDLTWQGCHKTITALLPPFLALPDAHICLQSSISGINLERRVWYPTNLHELEARLQQIWNEMSQNIIQNLYASIPGRIASCICARGGSTGY